jgi:hypothetical protein
MDKGTKEYLIKGRFDFTCHIILFEVHTIGTAGG